MHGYTKELDKRLKYDVAAAKKLMADAGYPNGFSASTLDCPNDRYNNDEQICQAVTGMLAQIGIKVDLQARSKTLHFPSCRRRIPACSCWAGACRRSIRTTSSPSSTRPTMRPRRWAAGTTPATATAKMDELTDAMLKEVDQAKRDKMIADAWALAIADMPYLPLHHQLIVWSMSDKVTIPIFANDSPNFKYSTIK